MEDWRGMVRSYLSRSMPPALMLSLTILPVSGSVAPVNPNGRGDDGVARVSLAGELLGAIAGLRDVTGHRTLVLVAGDRLARQHVEKALIVLSHRLGEVPLVGADEVGRWAASTD